MIRIILYYIHYLFRNVALIYVDYECNRLFFQAIVSKRYSQNELSPTKIAPADVCGSATEREISLKVFFFFFFRSLSNKHYITVL